MIVVMILAEARKGKKIKERKMMVVGRESEGETEVSVQMRRETGERMALMRRRVWEGIVNYRGRRGREMCSGNAHF